MSPRKIIEEIKKSFPNQPPYQWSRFDSSPWTPISKPLSKSRVALISSGGVYIRDEQEPFNAEKNDLSFRIIPKNISVSKLAISHYLKHPNAEKDINCIFPIERFRELEKEGFIGGLADPCYTFMGRIFRRTALQTEMCPQLIEMLGSCGVDLLFLVPSWPLCHQSVGLIARAVEGSGIPTITLSAALDITELVKPPRAVFVDFPLGSLVGKPFDIKGQINLIKNALKEGVNITKPGSIVELPYFCNDDLSPQTCFECSIDS